MLRALSANGSRDGEAVTTSETVSCRSFPKVLKDWFEVRLNWVLEFERDDTHLYFTAQTIMLSVLAAGNGLCPVLAAKKSACVSVCL